MEVRGPNKYDVMVKVCKGPNNYSTVLREETAYSAADAVLQAEYYYNYLARTECYGFLGKVEIIGVGPRGCFKDYKPL